MTQIISKAYIFFLWSFYFILFYLLCVLAAPEAPSEVNCISNNWENLTCQWFPKHNYVQTKHSIAFKLPGRAGARTIHPCPERYAQSTENKCMWDLTTDPIYRQPYPRYIIMMNIQNVLGTLSRTYDFDHYASGM